MADSALSLQGKLEDAFLAAADNASGAVKRLAGLIDGFGEQVDPVVAKALTEYAPLIAEDHERVAKDSELQRVLMKVARLGGSGMPLRDALAVICRRSHNSYPDPAGLIRALGILDPEVPMAEVCNRWERFDCLVDGNYAWHESYGLGRIIEIDGFSDLYSLQFAARQSFNLHGALTSLSVVKQDSLVARLLSEPPREQPPASSNQDFVLGVKRSFSPALNNPWPAVESILVPRFVRSNNFSHWKQSSSSGGSSSESGGGRSWQESRSLEELKVLLQDAENIAPTPQAIENLAKIFRFSASRKNFRQVLAETLALLKDKSADDAWLDEILRALPENTVSWEPWENFSKVTSKLKAKERQAWLELAARARGKRWFIDATLVLPHRFWSTCEEILDRKSEEFDGLVERVKEQVRRGESSADSALWLWELPDGRGRDAFANPNSVFRILSQPAAGDHLKARKKLFSLLMDDKTFQASLMRGGSEEGIQAFVRAIKTSSVLQKGEQQSLLVKIVRIFPEAKSIVEERQEVVARRPLPKITSFRSMHLRHEELREIVNVKIPQNSDAIAHARSYGDLRENAEYKAAKDEQRLLMARRGELEKALKEVAPTDFSEVVVGDIVIPGCTVRLQMEGKDETYYILGLWDSEPDRHILSYDTPLGRKLIGRTIGTSIEVHEALSGVIIDIQPLPEEIHEWVKLPGTQ